MQNNFRHLIYRLRHDYFTRGNIFTVVILVVFLMLCWSSVSVMNRNWQQLRQIDTKKAVTERLKAEVETLEYERIYLASPEYQEISARAKQNKKLPGETMLILPPNSPAAASKYHNTDGSEPPKMSNAEEWRAFLFPNL